MVAICSRNEQQKAAGSLSNFCSIQANLRNQFLGPMNASRTVFNCDHEIWGAHNAMEDEARKNYFFFAKKDVLR